MPNSRFEEIKEILSSKLDFSITDPSSSWTNSFKKKFFKRKTEETKKNLEKLINEATVEMEEKVKELEENKNSLEKKVKERTQEIEKRAKDLEKSRTALMNILEDVKDARDRAEEEKNKTLSIIANFVDGLIVFDKTGNITMVNPFAEKMFETREEDIRGRNIMSMKDNLFFTRVADLITEKGKIKRVDRVEFSLKEDSVIEATTVFLKKEAERIGFLAIFHDISREKTVERLKTEFVSLAAHQLRTPLSAIKWSLALLKEGSFKGGEKDDVLDKASQSNNRMISLINDLLNVTRIEEGKYIYNPKRADIVEVIKQSIQSAIEAAKIKNVNFSFKPPKEGLPKVSIDEEKIGLSIQNLAENAVHYTESGGNVQISIYYDKDKQEIVCFVKDSGVGIPQMQQKRIFTKFFRGENVMRMETEGSGLGLFIVKNIIEAHKGKIWFESKDGEGSTFYFSLPAKS